MPKNVDGEFEVLLGNKQLLSVFFIVVILLAVFFTMGYIVGRSTGSSAEVPKTASNQAAPAVQTPTEARTDPPAQETKNEEPPPAVETAQAETAAKTGTQPQQQLPSTEPRKPLLPPVTPPAAAPAASAGPVAGQVYLQVVAGKRPDAELVAGVLKRKGFAVLVAPGPTASVFRVLVGPFADSVSLGKTRTELETAGFKAFPRRY